MPRRFDSASVAPWLRAHISAADAEYLATYRFRRRVRTRVNRCASKGRTAGKSGSLLESRLGVRLITVRLALDQALEARLIILKAGRLHAFLRCIQKFQSIFLVPMVPINSSDQVRSHSHPQKIGVRNSFYGCIEFLGSDGGIQV